MRDQRESRWRERVTFGPYLDRNFISGEEIIIWNKADAERFPAE